MIRQIKQKIDRKITKFYLLETQFFSITPYDQHKETKNYEHISYEQHKETAGGNLY